MNILNLIKRKNKKNVKRVFIAATRQDDGKTSLSLGLIEAFKKRFQSVGFIKPVGQRYLMKDGYMIDEDSVLVEAVCGVKCKLKDMSPIAIEKGFTEKYIEGGNPDYLGKKIKASFEKISEGKDLIVIEGTGHAGVGSVFDWSNANVASLLKSKVILISSGGIGKPIDEIILNKALFEKEGVEILGVIVNKVKKEKFEKINRIVRKGFARHNIDVLGVMPYEYVLTKPTIAQILEETNLEILLGHENIENTVSKIIICAMEPHEALNYMEDKCLIITPGDREDILLTALTAHTMSKKKMSISGIIITGGIRPNKRIMELVSVTNIPILAGKKDTYKIASKIHDLTIKLQSSDKSKIKMVRNMVEQYIDINKILEKI